MKGTMRELNLIIAGVGGQGSILLTHIIGNAAIAQGLMVRAAETYGAAMRGGSVHGQIRIGEHVIGPLIIEDKADVLLALEPLEGLRVGVKYLSPSATALLNTRPLKPVDVNVGKAEYPCLEEIIENLEKVCGEVYALDATKLAEEAGNVRTLNIVMLGGLASTGKLPIADDTIKETIAEHVPKGTEEVNLKAYNLGKKAFEELIRSKMP